MQTTIAAVQTTPAQHHLPCLAEIAVAQLFGSMKQQATVTMAPRSPHGSPLDATTLADLRRALLEHGGARRLAPVFKTSPGSLERAAAEENILRGTESLIVLGLQRLQAIAGGNRR